MKSTGVVRKVDKLGRIVLPKELRRVFDIKGDETSLEIYTEGEKIVLAKYQPACIFCGEGDNIINYKGKNVCEKCLKELKND
ncbi:AbrB/MazE/SpoVT family DNA-binding domain-containing protein [Clostridium oceanicum]|uniref:AbrB/MazE/SpoVT family DNA-binding domain-containing protein n=1 Tax=Clostridium oceanicum TaxID=1543 RepID=A0ABN1JDB0_9CLOT